MTARQRRAHPYREGERARIAGVPLQGCPYPQKTDEWHDWRKGWLDTDFCI